MSPPTSKSDSIGPAHPSQQIKATSDDAHRVPPFSHKTALDHFEKSEHDPATSPRVACGRSSATGPPLRHRSLTIRKDAEMACSLGPLPGCRPPTHKGAGKLPGLEPVDFLCRRHRRPASLPPIVLAPSAAYYCPRTTYRPPPAFAFVKTSLAPPSTNQYIAHPVSTPSSRSGYRRHVRGLLAASTGTMSL